jgi:hypothetical protein
MALEKMLNEIKRAKEGTEKRKTNQFVVPDKKTKTFIERRMPNLLLCPIPIKG